MFHLFILVYILLNINSLDKLSGWLPGWLRDCLTYFQNMFFVYLTSSVQTPPNKSYALIKAMQYLHKFQQKHIHALTFL